MRLQSMHVGMKVQHPEYGVGTVKSISEHVADIRFDSGLRTISPEHTELSVAEPTAEITGLNVPLSALISETVGTMLQELGLEKDDSIVEQLGTRWRGGKIVLHPEDPTLQTKEVPLPIFFHKIIMVRNNLRVLEQKINAHEQLSDADKIEMQQYITRSYGSLTTFNILFKDKEGQF